MKGFLLLCCLFVFGFSYEMPQDSTRRNGPFRDFNLCFNWFELGSANALKTKKLENLPPGINEYLNGSKNGTHFAFFGVSFYYRNKFGFGLLYSNYELNARSDSYRNYMTGKYPDYFVPTSVRNYNYSIETVMFNFSYRKHFKYFFIEPKLKIGFNSFYSGRDQFRLKEKGSNQYIQVEISEQKKGWKNSYHAAFNIAHRFRKSELFPIGFEAGGSAEFFVVPIQSQFTYTERPFNGSVSTTVYEINRWNPAMSFSVFLNMYF